MTRIFAAGLALEANTFSPLPSSYQSFAEKCYFPPGTHPPEATLQTCAFWVARDQARHHGYTLIEGSCFAAQPGGMATRAAYERMRDEILGQLQAAMPVDAVVLALHGAMVADGYPDCEGDFLAHVRRLVGPKVVIGVELDPHCHLTVERLALADITILYKEYPHTDFVARGEEVVALVMKTLRGEIRPVNSLYDCRMLSFFPTTRQPMRALVDRCSALEGRDGILSVSIGHGFYFGDVPQCGARILVVTDNNKALGDRIATEIGEALFALRQDAVEPMLSADDAIDAALALPGPVVIADTTDNAGAGAPSDNTTFLHRLIARKVSGSAVGPVWDPVAVRLAHDAGAGACLPFRFGGKVARTSGLPVDSDVRIVAAVRDAQQSFAGTPAPLGDAASLMTPEGVACVLISNRSQAMGHDLFGNLGIDPKTQRILVVKSNQHFYASFAPLASKVIYAAADGPLAADPRQLPFRHIQRPIWPLDATVDRCLLL